MPLTAKDKFNTFIEHEYANFLNWHTLLQQKFNSRNQSSGFARTSDRHYFGVRCYIMLNNLLLFMRKC